MFTSFYKEKYDYNLIPLFHHENPKGHGLTDIYIMKYLEKLKPSVLIIPDAGSNDIEQMKYLSDKGWLILCFDHHKIEVENPYCILVSNQFDEVENHYGSGAVVTFKVMQAIDKELARKYVSYASISIVSDSMNITSYENVTFLKWGLEYDKLPLHLKDIVCVLNKDDFTPHGYAFGFITNCNSVIRLGTLEDKQKLFSFLCGNGDDGIVEICQNYHNQQSAEARKIASEINIDDYKDDNIILVDMDSKSPLLGLVANKVASSANKTVMLVNKANKSEYLGSCRSPINAKALCNDLFTFAKGHESAFGVSFPIENFDKIKDYFNSLDKDKLTPSYNVLTTFDARKIPDRYFDIFNGYNLYGVGVEEPKFYIKNIQPKDITRYSTVLKFWCGNVSYIKFFPTQKFCDELIEKSYNNNLEVVGTLKYNEYNGAKNPQVIIDYIDYVPKKEITLGDIF